MFAFTITFHHCPGARLARARRVCWTAPVTVRCPKFVSSRARVREMRQSRSVRLSGYGRASARRDADGIRFAGFVPA
jgi:hypothetical protein